MKFTSALIAAVPSVALWSSLAAAQTPPFFGGGAIGFDPEISTVNSGALVDAQVVVSDDRRYVTINMRPSLSHLNSLNTFPVGGFVAGGASGGGGGGTGASGGGTATGGGAQAGFVGNAGFIDNAEMTDVEDDTPAPRTSPAEAEAKVRSHPRAQIPPGPAGHVSNSPSEILKIDSTASNSVLRKEGMYLIAPAPPQAK
jgi:hypothetical protein